MASTGYPPRTVWGIVCLGVGGLAFLASAAVEYQHNRSGDPLAMLFAGVLNPLPRPRTARGLPEQTAHFSVQAT